MGAGVLNDFEPEIETSFREFLRERRSEGDGVELVINGDLLDFVQAPPFKGPSLRADGKDGTRLCFTEPQSLEKLEAIASDHDTAFTALREFLAFRPGNRL